MPNSAAMLRCSSLRFVLSTLSARLASAVHSPFNNDPIRLCVFSIFALLTLLGTNQIRTEMGGGVHLAASSPCGHDTWWRGVGCLWAGITRVCTGLARRLGGEAHKGFALTRALGPW